MAKNLETLRDKLFWGGDETKRKIHWIKWENVLIEKSQGGLDIGSLEALNIALMQKWRWRFFNSTNMLWANAIRALYGDQGGFEKDQRRKLGSGPWARVVQSSSRLGSKGVDIDSCLRKKLGNGCTTKFWSHVWVGDRCLKDRFPRGFPLDRDKQATAFREMESRALVLGLAPFDHQG